MIEIDVLQRLARHDVGGTRYGCYVLFFPLLVVELRSVFGISGFILCSCVQIRNWFDYRNHICIVSIYWCF
jgi:dual-specificity kinase